jgi:hypothetical protein
VVVGLGDLDWRVDVAGSGARVVGLGLLQVPWQQHTVNPKLSTDIHVDVDIQAILHDFIDVAIRIQE